VYQVWFELCDKKTGVWRVVHEDSYQLPVTVGVGDYVHIVIDESQERSRLEGKEDWLVRACGVYEKPSYSWVRLIILRPLSEAQYNDSLAR